ncbi:MAG: transcriptional regulator, Crp/Fnr family [Acidobacteria bacterium]|nr:transcriptional regulator, Crp/Fnr family [Acidobacteriota bacterium]
MNKLKKKTKIFTMIKDKVAVFKQTDLFRDLNEDVLRVLTSRAVEKILNRNEILFLAGDEAAGLFVIATGAIRAFRTGADGREQIIHIERAVSTIAEVPVFDDGKYPSTTAAEEDATTVYFLDKRKVRAVCLKHPEVALAATRLLAARLRHCAELVESLSLREVGQRLACLLLAEAETKGNPNGKGVCIKQKLTHKQLASRIGTVREVITRVIYRLQNQGLISVDGKEIFIPSLAALAAYADSDKN